MRITESYLRLVLGKIQPTGFVDRFLAVAKRDGDWLILTGEELDSFAGRQPRPVRGLGDVVERLAKPIAVALKMDCLDEKTQLKPDSPCAKKRDKLNKAVPFSTRDGLTPNPH